MVLLNELPAEVIQEIAFEVALTEQKQANSNPLALLFRPPRTEYLPLPCHLPALLRTCSRFHTLLNYKRNPAFYARLFRFHYDTLAISRRFPSLALQPHALAAEYRHRAVRIRHILQHPHIHSDSHSLDHGEDDHLANLWTIYLLAIENDGKNVLVLNTINTLQYLDGLASDPSLPLHQPTDDYPQNSAAHALALHIRNLILHLPRLHTSQVTERLDHRLRPFVFAAHKFDAFIAPWTYEHLPLGLTAREDWSRQRQISSPSSSSLPPRAQAQPPNPYLADLTPREKIHQIPYCGGVLRLVQPNPVLPACQLFFGLIEQADPDGYDDDELPELSNDASPQQEDNSASWREGPRSAQQHSPVYSSTAEAVPSTDRTSRVLTCQAIHHALIKGDIHRRQLLDALQSAAVATSSASASEDPLPADAVPIATAALAASIALNNARSLSSSADPTQWANPQLITSLETVMHDLTLKATNTASTIDWQRTISGALALINPSVDQQQPEGSVPEYRTAAETGDLWALLSESLQTSHAGTSQLDERDEFQNNISTTYTHLIAPTFPSSEAHDLDFERLTACLSPYLSPGLGPLRFSTCLAGSWEGRFAFFDFDSYRDMLASGSARSLMGEGQYGEQAQVWKLEESVVKVRRKKAEVEHGRSAWRGGWTETAELEEDADQGQEEVEEEEEERIPSSDEDGDDEMEEVEEIAISGVGHSAWGHFVLKGRVRPWDGLVSLVKEYCPDGRGRWRYRGYLVAGGRMVGRWRDTFSPPQYIGYEGCFLMQRREGVSGGVVF